jgi:hypothetical protein
VDVTAKRSCVPHLGSAQVDRGAVPLPIHAAPAAVLGRRIAALKRQVEDGTYVVDPYLIADGLFARSRGLGRARSALLVRPCWVS